VTCRTEAGGTSRWSWSTRASTRGPSAPSWSTSGAEWIPLSLVEDEGEDTITIPTWKAVELGLVEE
jgi:hypothetical protein